MTVYQTNCSLSFPVVCYSGALPLWAHLLLLLLRSGEDLSGRGGLFHSHQGASARLERAECMFRVTSDLLRSTPQQGRPLREQQEVAAAVIQRCYKKYKQVSFETDSATLDG